MHCTTRKSQSYLFQEMLSTTLFKAKSKAPCEASHGEGATNIIMFTGIMNAERLRTVFQAGLLPYIQNTFPDGHRLQQDNDPKHASGLIDEFFEENHVNWWPTPPESPDLNPIENVWGSLKQYLRNFYKPQNLDQLKDGIQCFWSTLTP